MEFQKFKKKPVVIEAFQLTREVLESFPLPENPPLMVTPMNIGIGNVMCFIERGTDMKRKGILIPTLEGTMTANIGDWIIKGINGEIYPCKPDIFAKTYDFVESI